MPVPEAVIPDVAGTLIASVSPGGHAWLDAVCDRGYGVAFEDVRRRIDKGCNQHVSLVQAGAAP